MKKAIKRYVTWALSWFITGFAVISSITLQAASPMYELNGNEKVKEHYEQLFRKIQGVLPLDMQKNPNAYDIRRNLVDGLAYMATYDKQWDDDTIHYRQQSLADDRISIIYQGDTKTTIGWSSPVFMVQIPKKTLA